ncbi:Asparagine--tRNA ligase, mitochondrial [Cytospora mali]|uniref:asparagine--tRNA ligase n=1 Tax=Cytospora mali TaxID=578113 RepID=A0A194VGZ1_CYTMA|nr:Asparagine--tRNA ligase, mitochondrial [Valsa mali var. pyri (nom. inval.)]
MKSRSFVALGDGSSLASLQAIVPTNLAEGLAIGAAIRLTGTWVPSPGAKQSHELHVNNVQILGPSDAKTFPIQKKYQTPEYLRTMPHLRPRTPFNSALLRLRSEAIATLTQFFATRDFVQTHPPIITSSDCEGGGEVFTVAPAHEQKKDDPAESFFRAPKYLTVSTQLHLEALAQAVGNVWTLSPTFRAEESDTSRHLSEFYMLEAEMSFVDKLDGVMDLTEDMLRYLSTNLYESRVAQELRSPGTERNSGDSAGDRAPPEEVDIRWQGLMQPAWPRITYSDAVNILTKEEKLFEHPVVWGTGLHSEHEKYIARVVGEGKPVFVTHYPMAIKPFYMRPTEGNGYHNSYAAPTHQETADCFDLLVPEYCEIAGGSMRENRLPQLLDAMKRQGMATPSLGDVESSGTDVSTQASGSLDWYVDLRRWGCPPHGGFGLGFDRLLGYLSGVQSIRDTVTFPRWYGGWWYLGSSHEHFSLLNIYARPVGTAIGLNTKEDLATSAISP